LWQKMAEESGQKSRGDFWSTHPSPPNRIDELTDLQEPMNKIYQARKDSYTADYVAAHQFVKMGGEPFANSTNVRLIKEGESTLAADVYVDPTQALAFYSEEYDAFKDGRLELECTNCGFSFYRNQSELNSLYEKQDWRGLAKKVTDINYKFDLSYLYLAFAAEGLGLMDVAKSYYAKALELSNTIDFSCADAKFIKCNGFDVKDLVNKVNS
jgi:hypothetical protein